MAQETDLSLLPWILTGVSAIMGALSTALVYLFRKTEYDNMQSIKEMKETNAQSIKELKEANVQMMHLSNECDKARSHLFTLCEVNKFEIESLKAALNVVDKKGTQHSIDREFFNKPKEHD